jgi:hypothetical protein
VAHVVLAVILSAKAGQEAYRQLASARIVTAVF